MKRNYYKSDAAILREQIRYKENINNRFQKTALLLWILRGTWQRRLSWKTHEPLISEEHDGTPGLCSSCNGVFTRRLWWRRKKVGEKSTQDMDERSSEQMLDCHSCFCDMDWEKALPLGYRGHVFGNGVRLKQPDWDNNPLHHLPLRRNHESIGLSALTVFNLLKWKHIVISKSHHLSTYYVDIVLCLHIIERNILCSSLDQTPSNFSNVRGCIISRILFVLLCSFENQIKA